MTFNTIGIDPGITGAIAILQHDELVEIVDMPTVGNRVDRHALMTIVTVAGDKAIVLEDVSTRPGLSANAVLTTGINWGIVYATACLWPVHVTTPQKWQKAIGVPKGLARDARKTWCRQRAMQLWPDMADKFNRTRDDGRADAALMALAHVWAQRGQVAA